MATMAVTLPLALKLNKPATLSSSLSSSSSVFFSYNSIELSRAAVRVSGNGKGNNNNDRRMKRGLSCNCLFGLGVPELVVIAGVVALVFGPKKLPEVGKSIGKTVKSFQQAAKEFESELKKDGEPSSAEPSGENITATAVNEEEKQEDKVPSNKETS